MKKNNRLEKDLRLEYNKGLLVLSVIFSLGIIAFIIYKYIILQVMTLSSSSFNYGINNIFTLIVSYIVGVIFIKVLYDATRILARHKPRIYIDTEGILINSLLGPEYHKWTDLRAFRVIKRSKNYTIFIQTKDKKAAIRRKNYVKRCVYFISFIMGGFGVECTFSVNAKECGKLLPTLKYNLTEDKKGFKTLLKRKK